MGATGKGQQASALLEGLHLVRDARLKHDELSGSETLYSAAEALGQSLDLIIPERFRTRNWDGYRQVMATGVTSYGQRLLAVPAMRKDGQRISIEFSIALLKDERGEVVGAAAIIRDVTARWQAEHGRGAAT